MLKTDIEKYQFVLYQNFGFGEYEGFIFLTSVSFQPAENGCGNRDWVSGTRDRMLSVLYAQHDRIKVEPLKGLGLLSVKVYGIKHSCLKEPR